MYVIWNFLPLFIHTLGVTYMYKYAYLCEVRRLFKVNFYLLSSSKFYNIHGNGINYWRKQNTLKIQDSLVELNLNTLMILEMSILKFTLLYYKVRKYRECISLVHLYIPSF